MRAILNQRHVRLRSMIDQYRDSMETTSVVELLKLEKELCSLFRDYQEAMENLRYLASQYEKREGLLKINIKKFLQQSRKKAKRRSIQVYDSAS